MISAVLCEIFPRRDPQLRSESLDERGHDIAPKYHPEKEVAVLRSGLDVRGEIAWINVGYTRNECWAQKGENSSKKDSAAAALQDFVCGPCSSGGHRRQRHSSKPVLEAHPLANCSEFCTKRRRSGVESICCCLPTGRSRGSRTNGAAPG